MHTHPLILSLTSNRQIFKFKSAREAKKWLQRPTPLSLMLPAPQSALPNFGSARSGAGDKKSRGLGLSHAGGPSFISRNYLHLG